MTTSLRCRVSAISGFCRPITQTPSITNCLVAIVHTKPVNSNISPKIDCHGNVPQHRWTPYKTWFLGPFEPTTQTASLSVQSFLHRWPQSLPILYNGMPLSPSKLPLPIGGSGPLSNTWLPGPTRVLIPNGISIGAAVFAGLTSVTDSDRPRYSVSNSRLHLCT